MRTRSLIVVTHLLGAGHLVRAAAIGRALARNGHEVTLVSGGRPVAQMSTAGLDLVQLPPVQARIGEFRILRDEAGREVGPAYLERRRRALLDALDRTAPDILVTELFPFGRRVLAGEFRALLDAARTMRPRPVVACSVRDILATPATAAKVADTHRTIAHDYDLVLVHSDPAVTSLDASWPVDGTLEGRLAYTGYLDAGEESGTGSGTRSGEIVVSGGSSAAALPLCTAAIEAARLAPDLSWRILVGAGVDAADRDRLTRTAGANVVVEPSRSDFRRLLASAGVFVGQAGYNTVMDLFATGIRAVLVPFEQGGETEQRLRAEQLARIGAATVLPESELDAQTLVASVRIALVGPAPRSTKIARDGASTTARLLDELLANHRAGRYGGKAVLADVEC